MITPRIHQRALRNGLQWRLLLLWWFSLLVPGVLLAHPVGAYLSASLDHSTRAKDLVASLDGATFIDLLRRIEESGTAAAFRTGLLGGLLALLLLAPFMAGVMVTAARSDEPLPLQRLLAGGGEMYGRMLRVALVGLVPLGAGGGLAALAMRMASKANERAIWESDASARIRNHAILAAVVFFAFHLLVDAARAHFAAEPTRRSAALALWGGVRLLIRRPLRMLAIGAVGTLAGLGVAFLFMALRLRIEQAGTFSIAAAWVMAQLAHVSVGWGRGTRIFGLTELIRADSAERARAFRMEAPASSPPPEVQSQTLEAPGPPPALSPPPGSGT